MKGVPMFRPGCEYTREEIHAQVGGSKQSYLPMKAGAVVAACLTNRLNPQAPSVVICGRGPVISRAGELLATQAYAIPVFLKRAVNRWEYQGLFRSVASYTSGAQFNEHVTNSGRPAAGVSRVVLLQPAGVPTDAA